MTDWNRAKCSGRAPELFFPEKGQNGVRAKAVCWGRDGRPECPIRQACLEAALSHKETQGIWGGYSERERRAMGVDPERSAKMRAIALISAAKRRRAS
jgi:hypothetical protein